LDLREQFLQAGGSKVEAARRFDLGRRTVYRYLAAAEAGALAPKTSWGNGARSIPKIFRRTLKNTPQPRSKNSPPSLTSAITPSGSGWENWASR